MSRIPFARNDCYIPPPRGSRSVPSKLPSRAGPVNERIAHGRRMEQQVIATCYGHLGDVEPCELEVEIKLEEPRPMSSSEPPVLLE